MLLKQVTLFLTVINLFRWLERKNYTQSFPFKHFKECQYTCSRWIQDALLALDYIGTEKSDKPLGGSSRN